MALRTLIRAMLPERVRTAVLAIRARRHSHRLNAEWGVSSLSEKLFDRLGPRVLAGPFAGLQLPRSAAAEHLGPYLLGTYERELHPYWETLTPGAFPLIVNVGAKFGYYSAGLSARLDAPAIAFDADPWARSQIRETASLNKARVSVRGQCRREDLEGLPAGTLVVIDCDGCEEYLLRAPLPAGLPRSTIVVELHDQVIDGNDVSALLAESHAVREVRSLPAPEAPAATDFLTAEERKLAVEEIREPQRWLICTPRG